MSNPRDFPKSLTMLQVLDTTMYAVTSMVIYRYAGPDVGSPALSSAGSVMKRVSYGLAIPTVRCYPPRRRTPLTRLLGSHCRYHLRPCREQKYLRMAPHEAVTSKLTPTLGPHFPWLAAHAETESPLCRNVGGNCTGPVDGCLDHCRIYPGFQ